MYLRKIIFSLLISTLLAFVFMGQVWSQPPGQRPSRDPDQRRKMFSDNIRKRLDFSEEEWQIIEPRFQKVMVLSMQSSGMGGRKGGPMGKFGKGSKGPSKGMDIDGQPGTPSGKGKGDFSNQRDQSRPPREQTRLDSLLADLNTALQDKDAESSLIKEKLTAVRAAREESKLELAKAQAELRELLTLRQEAIFVMMGILN